MNSWLGKALKKKEETYPINTTRGREMWTVSKIGAVIRKKLKASRSVRKLFEQFNVPFEMLDRLKVEIRDLEVYGETDSEKTTINANLFRGGAFFENYQYLLHHEITHYIIRNSEKLKVLDAKDQQVSEKSPYLSDPEEVLCFVSSIAFELERGTDEQVIWDRIYPKIEWHIHSDAKGEELFRRMIEKAKNLLIS